MITFDGARATARDRQEDPAERLLRHRRAWMSVGAVGAFIAAGLLLLVPTTTPTTAGLPEDWSLRTIDTFAPFEFTITVDTELPGIVTSLDAGPVYEGEVANLTFSVAGATGDGLVAIEAHRPSGETSIRDLSGPDYYYQYPPDPDTVGWFRVEANWSPTELPEPGGEVLVVIDVSNPAANFEPLSVTWIGIEPYAMAADGGGSGGGSTELPRACGDVAFPISIDRGDHVVCWHRFDIAGREGETIEAWPFAVGATADSGTWSGEPIAVLLGPPGPALPPAAAGDLVRPWVSVERPDPITDGIVTDRPGRYRITFRASEGSPGFSVSVAAQRTDVRWPWRESGPGFEIGLAFLGAGLVAATGRRAVRLARMAAPALLAAGAAIPAALVADSDHTWYWKPYSHLAWAPALAIIAVGAYLLFRTGTKPARIGALRVMAWAVSGLAALLLTITALSSWSYGDSWVGGRFPGSYGGDYMLMGIHVLAMALTAPTLAAAAALFGASGPRAHDAASPTGSELP